MPLAVPHRRGAWGPQTKKADENGWGATRLVGPLYEFGFGLSYTSFEYGKLSISPEKPTEEDKITISCDVKNTGDRAGDEIVQLYIQDVVASVAPFDQVLRGFERVSLEPGESKTVTFELSPKRDLKMLNRDKRWVVEPGKFEVRVGTSSSKKGILQTGEFSIQSNE